MRKGTIRGFAMASFSILNRLFSRYLVQRAKIKELKMIITFKPPKLSKFFSTLIFVVAFPNFLQGDNTMGYAHIIEGGFIKVINESQNTSRASLCGGIRLALGGWIPPGNAQKNRPVDPSLRSISVGEKRRYLRKSITFYKEFVLSKNISLPLGRYNYLDSLFNEKVINNIRLSRFDRNPIPDNLMTNAESEFKKSGTDTDKIKEILEKTLVPHILKVVETEKEIRAKEYVNEQERQNFLTSKGKELGITAEDLEKIMNTAFIFVPYITGYNKYKDSGDGLNKYSISGGLLIYYVRTLPSVSVILIKDIKSDGKTSFIDAWSGQSNDELIFKSAAYSFCDMLDVEICKIFRIHGDIISVYKDKVELELGKKHGIRIDDKFDFIEFYEGRSGDLIPKNIGYGIITKIGKFSPDNKSDLTVAQVITGKPAKGMLAVERPSSPFEIKFGVVSHPFKIKSSDESKVIKENTYCLNVILPFLVADNDIRMLISDETGIPHTYMNLTLFAMGFSNSHFVYAGRDFRAWELIYGELVGLGILKKIYYRRFVIGAEAKLKLLLCGFSYPSQDTTYDLATYGIGVVSGPLFEYVITPHINLGAHINYGFGVFTPWEGPNVSLSKIGWQVYVAWNPPGKFP